MAIRTATAEWKGDLPSGNGTFEGKSGALGGAYSFQSRFTDEGGTNPEELIAAAHAGCFSMALSAGLSKARFEPTSVRTTATVNLVPRDVRRPSRSTKPIRPLFDRSSATSWMRRQRS